MSKTSFFFMLHAPQKDDDMTTLWHLLPVPYSTSVDDELMMIGPCTGCCISTFHDAIVEQNGESFPSKRQILVSRRTPSVGFGMQRLSRSLFSRHSKLEYTITRFHYHQGSILEEPQLAIFNISLRLVDF
jgi:hypothetical protein